MFKQFAKRRREYIELKKNELRTVRMYEKLKKELLAVNAAATNHLKETELITQINILAEIINEPKIDAKNISDTLRVYPSKCK